MMMVLPLLSCKSVTVHDEIFYGNKGMVGAVEFHTMTSDQRDISFEDWMQLLRTQPMICSSVNTYGDVKSSFEKVCSICNCCTDDTKKAAEEFFNNLATAEGKMKP